MRLDDAFLTWVIGLCFLVGFVLAVLSTRTVPVDADHRRNPYLLVGAAAVGLLALAAIAASFW